MSYNSFKIKEIIEMIGRNEIYLPAIQRKFVWGHDQIEKLFDSIMRGYPIGTFLFWYVYDEKINEYTFYKFLQNYHQRDQNKNEIAPQPELKDKIIGVLDGQQRLSSIYVALQGTYAYKQPYYHWNSDWAFPKREFFLNLFPIHSNESECLYDFRFLTDDELKKTNVNLLWFKVKEILNWGQDPDIDAYYDSLEEKNDSNDGKIKNIIKNKKNIKKILRILHQRIILQDLISYYKIEEQELDNILDIFVRVNSAGTVLSKSDLLFSTIVANWQEGREEIDALLSMINKKGDGFYFNNDFIMRVCLVLSDLPVLFKVNSFKRESIKTIMSNWKDIKRALINTIDALISFGFNGDRLTSQNAVIPIAYFIYKGGNLNEESKANIERYLINALIKQVYGSQGDSVLSTIRERLRVKSGGNKFNLRNKIFDFFSLAAKDISMNKSLKIEETDIEDILEYKKGAYTFMVLSMLYPHLRFGQIKFHQDHLHPDSYFKVSKLKKSGILQEKVEEWIEKKDMLPNLQLLEGAENQSKKDTSLIDWIEKKIEDKERYKADNFIPSDLSLK